MKKIIVKCPKEHDARNCLHLLRCPAYIPLYGCWMGYPKGKTIKCVITIHHNPTTRK